MKNNIQHKLAEIFGNIGAKTHTEKQGNIVPRSKVIAKNGEILQTSDIYLRAADAVREKTRHEAVTISILGNPYNAKMTVEYCSAPCRASDGSVYYHQEAVRIYDLPFPLKNIRSEEVLEIEQVTGGEVEIVCCYVSDRDNSRLIEIC